MFRIVVSSDSIKNATATSFARQDLLAGCRRQRCVGGRTDRIGIGLTGLMLAEALLTI